MLYGVRWMNKEMHNKELMCEVLGDKYHKVPHYLKNSLMELFMMDIYTDQFKMEIVKKAKEYFYPSTIGGNNGSNS